MRCILQWGISAMLVGGAACEATPPPWKPHELQLLESLSGIEPLPPSPDNPHADDPLAASWGRALFFDPGLSREGRVACASCHIPERAFTDGRQVAFGQDLGQRNTPTLLGAAWYAFFGWDGHTDSVTAQSLGALTHPLEHDRTPPDVASWVLTHHRTAYEGIFGALSHESLSEAEEERVFVNVGRALEAYLRRLSPGPAPFDAYVSAVLRGDPQGGGHLSPAAQRGLRAFVREGCVDCHHGPRFTDGGFHNLGLPPSIGLSDADRGRARGAQEVKVGRYRCGGPFSQQRRCDALLYLNPDFADFEGAFKTPTLRNVARTAPYMHTGQFPSLEAVLEFYRDLPHAPRVGRRDPQLLPRGSTLPVADVAAFLRALTAADLAEEHDIPSSCPPSIGC